MGKKNTVNSLDFKVDLLGTMLVKGLQVTEVRKLAKLAAEDPLLLNGLITHVSSQKPTPAMKASWILAKAIEENPNLSEEVLSEVLNCIVPSQQGGVLRELFKGLLFAKVPESLHGKHIGICFDFLNAPVVDVAVRYNAMKTLDEYTKLYPEISGELLESLEFQVGRNTTTFDHMAAKIIKKLEKRFRK